MFYYVVCILKAHIALVFKFEPCVISQTKIADLHQYRLRLANVICGAMDVLSNVNMLPQLLIDFRFRYGIFVIRTITEQK